MCVCVCVCVCESLSFLVNGTVQCIILRIHFCLIFFTNITSIFENSLQGTQSLHKRLFFRKTSCLKYTG